MRMYKAETLNKLMQICKEAGVLCIADEVMTGFGRTGTTFAVNQTEAKPDLSACLRIIRRNLTTFINYLYQRYFRYFFRRRPSKAFLHGHSFTGNPIGCTAAIASLDLLEKKECQIAIKNIAKIMKYLQNE